MNTFTKKLPTIVDLQPEADQKRIRLPEWMKFFFVGLYLVTLIGTGFLLKESFAFFQLYQTMLAAQRTTTEAVVQINALQAKLSEYKALQRDYENFKQHQKSITRPGPLLEWLPSWVGPLQKAHTITIQEAGQPLGSLLDIRITIEKPIGENIVRSSLPLADYQLQSASEESPKFNELPQNQRPAKNNEFTTIAIQLKRIK